MRRIAQTVVLAAMMAETPAAHGIDLEASKAAATDSVDTVIDARRERRFYLGNRSKLASPDNMDFALPTRARASAMP
ncbi:MAG: hypothetical protein AAGD34_12835 [Pseudomonadota bacterium]